MKSDKFVQRITLRMDPLCYVRLGLKGCCCACVTRRPAVLRAPFARAASLRHTPTTSVGSAKSMRRWQIEVSWWAPGPCRNEKRQL